MGSESRYAREKSENSGKICDVSLGKTAIRGGRGKSDRRNRKG